MYLARIENIGRPLRWTPLLEPEGHLQKKTPAFTYHHFLQLKYHHFLQLTNAPRHVVYNEMRTAFNNAMINSPSPTRERRGCKGCWRASGVSAPRKVFLQGCFFLQHHPTNGYMNNPPSHLENR